MKFKLYLGLFCLTKTHGINIKSAADPVDTGSSIRRAAVGNKAHPVEPFEGLKVENKDEEPCIGCDEEVQKFHDHEQQMKKEREKYWWKYQKYREYNQAQVPVE